jgi:hypothetical protein
MGVRILMVIGFGGYLIAFLNSVWVSYGIWRLTKRQAGSARLVAMGQRHAAP